MKKQRLLIRHGRSVTNGTEKYQAGDQFANDPLDTTGESQGALVAREFERQGYVPDHILSSGLLRARQTARFIGKATGTQVVIPVYDKKSQVKDIPLDQFTSASGPSLFRELDLPLELEGRDYADPVAAAIKDALEAHLYEPGWHYSNEENLYDIWKRAGVAKRELAERPEDRLCVATHGGFMKAIIAHVLFDDQPDWSTEQKLQAYQAFTKPSWVDNTGIVSLFYDTDKARWQWIMADNRHLGTTFGFMLEEPGPAAETSADELRTDD